MPSRTFCSETNGDEPMAGTGDVVGAWLLLEYRPIWRARAVQDNDLAPRTRAWLDATVVRLAAMGVRLRPLLVRQPELDVAEVRCLVGLPDRLLEFSGTGYDWLETLDLPEAMSAPDQFNGRRLVKPRYFVCTNGQRDLCCARFGLPAYAALRQVVGDRVWQVTHLGGHRFAPNVLLLPGGLLYGRVTPESVPAFVDHIESDGLALPWLRGRTFYPKPVQAAEVFAGQSGLRLLHVDGDDVAARVRFAGPEGIVEVGVARSESPRQILASCGDSEPELVYSWQPA